MTASLNYKNAAFLLSAAGSNQFPSDEGFEVAFVGRSNAGKSSALNALTQQKNLARTSKTPGRTQLINFFMLDIKHRLVDLPGYGYAKVTKKMRSDWRTLISYYLESRSSLKGIILLVDIRHPLKDFDLDMIHWCVSINLPIHVLLTKADKLSFSMSKTTLLKVTKSLTFPNVTTQIFSAITKTGVDELKSKLNQWFKG